MARTKQKEFTKEILANRAGNRCSNPECLALISGAAGKSFLNVGEAAHIYAVSEGGPRFDSTLSEEYVRSLNNGIWLCKICHAKVDNKRTDEYPAELLIEWKNKRELDARAEVGIPQPIQTNNLLKDGLSTFF